MNVVLALFTFSLAFNAVQKPWIWPYPFEPYATFSWTPSAMIGYQIDLSVDCVAYVRYGSNGQACAKWWYDATEGRYYFQSILPVSCGQYSLSIVPFLHVISGADHELAYGSSEIISGNNKMCKSVFLPLVDHVDR